VYHNSSTKGGSFFESHSSKNSLLWISKSSLKIQISPFPHSSAELTRSLSTAPPLKPNLIHPLFKPSMSKRILVTGGAGFLGSQRRANSKPCAAGGTNCVCLPPHVKPGVRKEEVSSAPTARSPQVSGAGQWNIIA
jgi:hypothetical protein